MVLTMKHAPKLGTFQYSVTAASSLIPPAASIACAFGRWGRLPGDNRSVTLR